MSANLRAPIAEWEHIDSFDKADDCRDGLAEHLRMMQQGKFADPSSKKQD
jgi:hypothetical protein